MRVGVIGTGAIGAWHARIVAEGGDELSAVCDLDAARAGAAAFGAQVFTDPDAFFASGLDAVIVATPEAQHEAHVTAAARAGIAVMVEKPVAPDMAAMRRMADAVAQAGIVAMAAHVERFEAGSAGLKTALDQGICGQVSAIFARRQFGPSEVARFAGSSSTLRVLGIHDFDLVRWLHPGGSPRFRPWPGAARSMPPTGWTTTSSPRSPSKTARWPPSKAAGPCPAPTSPMPRPRAGALRATTGWRSSAPTGSCRTTCR
jgi:predicted dehydrogenase